MIKWTGLFENKTTINYKHLCGEYPTSTAFALWVAANIIKTGTVAGVLGIAGQKKKRSTGF